MKCSRCGAGVIAMLVCCPVCGLKVRMRRSDNELKMLRNMCILLIEKTEDLDEAVSAGMVMATLEWVQGDRKNPLACIDPAYDPKEKGERPGWLCS
jgi:hypothetical protein